MSLARIFQRKNSLAVGLGLGGELALQMDLF